VKTKTAFVIFLIFFTCCKSSNQKAVSAKDINDRVIVLTNNYQDTAKFKQALNLLNDAILLDGDYLDSYRKKVFFETALNDFIGALNTSTELIKFRPDSADLYFQRGLFKELTNDSLSARPDFIKAVLLYKQAWIRWTKKILIILLFGKILRRV